MELVKFFILNIMLSPLLSNHLYLKVTFFCLVIRQFCLKSDPLIQVWQTVCCILKFYCEVKVGKADAENYWRYISSLHGCDRPYGHLLYLFLLGYCHYIMSIILSSMSFSHFNLSHKPLDQVCQKWHWVFLNIFWETTCMMKMYMVGMFLFMILYKVCVIICKSKIQYGHHY